MTENPSDVSGMIADADRLHLQGVQAYQVGRNDLAVTLIGRALSLVPDSAPFHNNQAAALNALGRHGEAEIACRRAITLAADFAEAHLNLGNALKGQRKAEQAAASFRQAIALKPGYAKAYARLGELFQEQGRLSEAAASYRQSIACKSDNAAVHNSLGAVLYALGRREDAAAACRQAVDCLPDYADARCNLAKILWDLDQVEQAVACLRLGLKRQPDHLPMAVLDALLCPIFPSREAIPAIRKRILDRVQAVRRDGRPLYPQAVGVCSFYPSYHGLDNREIQSAIAAMYRRVAPSLTEPLPQIQRRGGQRIRVGFLSANLTAHTIGSLNVGLIEMLDRDRFETVVLRTQPAADPLAQRIDRAAASVVLLPSDLAAARQVVAAQGLDLLYFPDIGMDPFTYYLAFSRLAPVQAVSWGHPETTGLETMDYFVSSACFEPDNACAHYTERLILLNRVNCYYHRPSAASRTWTRADLGLPERGRLYGCPQTLMKIHPDFDAVLADIVKGDPDGYIVLLAGSNPAWVGLLRARWAKTFPELLDRTVFLPQVPREAFVALQAQMDVLLDPIHFGGGHTFYEAMAVGTPVVTWPGDFLRSRIAAGGYRQMGLADAPVVERIEDYAPLALALARDPDRRAAFRQAARASADRDLFTDLRGVRDFEAFLTAAVAANRRGTCLPSGWSPDQPVGQDPPADRRAAVTPSAEELFAQARMLHQAGRLDDAEQLCRQAMAADPNHADSAHLLGLIAFAAKRHHDAAAWIERSIASDGSSAAFHCNLGAVLKELRRLDEAEAACRRAITLDPNFAGAYFNLGNTLKEQGQLEEAIAAHLRATELKPDYDKAHNNQGVALKELGRLDEAAACHRRAIACNPDSVEAHSNLGLALKELGRLDEAMACHLRVITLKPDYAEAHFHLGTVLTALERLNEAEARYRKAISLKPDFADVHNGLGIVLQRQGRLDEAMVSHRKAIALKPDDAGGHTNLGVVLQEMGQLDQALACHRKAIALHPKAAMAHWNLALVLLLSGDFDEGWRHYEWRWKASPEKVVPTDFPQPQWRGEAAQGKILVIHAEQGYGDSLQFCRYAALAAARGLRVILLAPKPLARLLRGVPGVERVVVDKADLPAFDLHCPMLSLPLALGTRVETIPAAVPYLSPDPALAAGWRERLGDDSAFKVGIAWRGNPLLGRDRQRSVGPALFSDIFEGMGVTLVSLLPDGQADEIDRLGQGGAVLNAGPDLNDFADTAALITNLDLVVSVDTSVCHLAGALGIPTWTMIEHIPDWRWLKDRDDSPWYPTMRLFRQPTRGDWAAVAEKIKSELSRQIQGHA